MKKPLQNASFSMFAFFFFCFSLLPRLAYPITLEEIPDSLRPWVQWVLEGENTIDCPRVYNNPGDRRCQWPTHLSLKLGDKKGRFRMLCRIFGDSRVALPGDSDYWPQNITVDGKSVPVLTGKALPELLLGPGTYDIQGEFTWQELPEALSIPQDTGIISLKINDSSVPFPDIDRAGRLWLKKTDRQKKGRQNIEDHLQIQVFRRIVDEIPMEIVTRIDLKVAGKERDIILADVLLEGFLPLRLSSPLPARIESGKSLRLTVRPGKWTLTLSARSIESRTAITLSKIPEPWPEREIWVFDSRNHLRLVKVDGLESVDPRQTNVPGNWHHLPAFRVKPGQTLKLNVIRRGDPEPNPDQLQLARSIWLDFNGRGYTLQDRITGTMTKGWRFETGPEIMLGQVLIDGVPQFITRLSDSRGQGVEVRRGRLNLVADARYEGGVASLPATGWDRDFQQVSAVLNLPPGWKLLAMGGVDNVPDTWFSRWTLMDLFLVLIIGISFFRLWSWRMGLISIALMVLIWHEPNAPRYVWLNILAAVALIRVLPEGRLKSLALYYRNIAFIVLVLIAIPFMIHQIVTGLFPQLEKPWQSIITRQEQHVQPDTAALRVGTAKRSITGAMESMPSTLSADAAKEPQKIRPSAMLNQVDPNAMVQTGPGIPQWSWRSISFNWNGPVKASQRMTVVLLSPAVNLALNFLRVILLVMMAIILFKTSFQHISRGPEKALTNAALAAVLCIGLFIPTAEAGDFPSSELLKELKSRLLEAPDCFPECAQISRMNLDADEQTLTLRLEIHAGASIALPLPGHADQWLPIKVLVNGKNALGLNRSKSGEIWLQVEEGIHQVIMAGPLPKRESVLLPLMLKPRFVTAAVKGWKIRGIRENGIADNQLHLERIREVTEKLPELSSEPPALPTFVKIERILRLGLDWTVENRMTRVAPRNTAIVIEVPLLKGESVTTAGFRVTAGKILVSMAPEQRAITWQSSIEKQSSLTLTAPETTSWTEIWKADVSAIWHTRYSGLTVIHHQDPAGNWLPEWRPWPGESLTLETEKPAGVEGQTLTVDNSRVNVTPGKRATDTQLTFSVNSSRGGQHTIDIPEDADLQSVLINNKAQPVRQKGGQVTLPVKPGRQSFILSLRSADAIKGVFTTPDVHLNTPSVNHTANVRLGKDRWVLWTKGPRLGPAVLFWGVLLVIFVVAMGLARIPLTPLKARHWFLLGIGLSQAPVFSGFLVVAWLYALGARKKMTADTPGRQFNLAQIGLVFLTCAAITALFFAVQKGLLGLPEMQISGNRSTAYNLLWFADRVNDALPAASVVSVPLLVYRLLMLSWALWLAFSLVSWLRWGWQCFSENGLWKKGARSRKKSKSTPE